MPLKPILLGFVLLSTTMSVAVAGSMAQLETVAAAEHLVEQEQLFDAVLEAINKTTVSAQTSGLIEAVLFDVDDFVEKDALLIQIKDTQQRASVAAAEARYAEAEVNYKRVKDLVGKKLASRSDFDKAEAALKGARAALAQAQEQLSYTKVRAPYSGIVTERHVEPGETASPGKTLMTGISLEQLRAVARVPQQHIDAVRKLAKARILLPGNSAEAELTGTHITISPYADPNSHTFFVRVDLPEGQHGLYPGMFAKVAVATGQRERLVIPASAVAYRSEVSAVYVVQDNGTVSMRQLRLGRKLADGNIEVLAGLQANEKVALDPSKAVVVLKEQRAGK